MKFSFLNRKKFWNRFALFALVFPLLLFGLALITVFVKQAELIQAELKAMNKTHKGLIVVGITHLAPFENFPYMSIKVDDVRIYESKETEADVILDVADIYIGFDIRDIISGNFDIQKLVVEDGFFNFVKHSDGSINLQNALAKPEDADLEEEEPIHIHLQKVELKSLNIHKLNEENMLDVEAFIFWAKGGFKTTQGEIAAHIDTEFELNIIDNLDTTYIKHKHFEFHTDVVFNEVTGLMSIAPSGITMEHGDFKLKGSIETKNEMSLNLEVNGEKPNFDMLIAFAPENLIPVLKRYENAGNIYFHAYAVGPTTNGQTPFIDAKFGATQAYMENTGVRRRVDELGFEGHFTNGEKKSLESMEFSILDFTARLEKGEFVGSVIVKNFENPEIDMELSADFNLDFLAEFFNLKDIENVSGKVKLDMHFHDIIDLDHPEKALSQLNQAYSTELKVQNLHVESDALPANIDDLDLHLRMEGKKGVLDLFDLKMGETDLSLKGSISDLPAIVHHTNIPILAELEIKSNKLDIAELTKFSEADSTGFDEQIEDFSLFLKFNSSARAFTESKYLPEGEFFVEQLHAQLKHYPHELHDFHVDVLIDESDLNIVDFTGFIDKSDFHFNGNIHDYGFWMKDSLEGEVKLDIRLSSDLCKLEDLFSYKGENYVPADYRHEQLEKLALHVNSEMHFKSSQLHSIDIELDRFQAKMHVHPMRFEDFNGNFHYEDEHLMIEKMHGKLGRTVFDVDMNYYLGDDESIKLRDNHFGLKANYIDFDQLLAFNTASPEAKVKSTASAKEDSSPHSKAFNIYELPFTDMTFDVDVGHFIYHRVNLQEINARLRTTHNHYLYVDTMSINAAGGGIFMSGYFNGSDPEHIYLAPRLRAEQVELDKLLFKFENFGQEEVVSENVHGKLSAIITGKVRVYPDMVPDLDESEIHLDVELLDGKLENYEPVLVLSDYMGDKDLSSVRFDTLKNHMDITNGLITIPNMTIESTLGHLEISGEQSMADELDYYIRIPWKLIKDGARYKLFGDKKTKDGEVGDDQIIEKDPNDKTRYLNLRILGNLEDYEIKISKK